MAFDVGCGDGCFTTLLAEALSEVLGIVNSDADLEEAEANCADAANVRFMKGDVNELPLEDASMTSLHSWGQAAAVTMADGLAPNFLETNRDKKETNPSPSTKPVRRPLKTSRK